VLSADRKVDAGRLEKTVPLGELALDGRVRPVRGVLPAVIAAKRDGRPAVVVPVDNLAEAVRVEIGDPSPFGDNRRLLGGL
jgi:magnesium chelatase family protein